MKSCVSKNKSNTFQETNFTIADFPHIPPEGYSYEFEEFKRGVVSIWLCNTRKFVYNGGTTTRTIHSFYNTKTREYFAPINSKTIGACVNITDTRNYTAMPLKLNPLEAAFV
jgi:hypothetical protein